MPKNPRFAHRQTDKGWLLNVPGSVSDTGRPRRRYFKTRDEAKAEASRLREIYNGSRDKASDIPPALAHDAVEASQLLDDYDVSLKQAAAFWIEQHDTRAKTPTLDEVWESAITKRRNHRPTTLADFRRWRKKMPAKLLAAKVCDITPKQIEKALMKATSGETTRRGGLRYIRAVFGDCVKAGILESKDNPAKRVDLGRPEESDDEVSIYTVEELEALFAACRDYPKGKDKGCAACAVPFAFLAFAGLRPDELPRLRWENVSLEMSNIRIGAKVAKKSRRRNVRINPTLAAWIQTIPEEDRVGAIVPGRWRYRAARVRREAGIDGKEKQDALRHSFGTYLLATENDLDALKADMGHEHVRVFFDHYNAAIHKRDALPYWQVLPEGVELETIKAA